MATQTSVRLADETRRLCRVHFDGWAGKYSVPAEVLKVTPKRVKVRFLGDVSARRRKGGVAYAPKYAVTME
jgi:hypothetical protein